MFPHEECESSIVTRFEQQVHLNPDRLALKTRTHTLTYAALNGWANRIAHAVLEARGEGSEPVALLLDQEALLLATILGVLKAGKAYVPLEPHYPPARSAEILRDSQAAIVVTDAAHAAAARPWIDESVRLLDAVVEPSRHSSENLDLLIPPDALAWILYTSGSTGRPKGVMQIHRNVLQNVRNYARSIDVDADDRLTLLASCSFAASVTDMFGAWLNGASLHPFSVRTEGLSPLAAWLVREEITVYHSVPTLFRHFTETLTGDEAFPRLRLIKVGGEPVLRSDVERYRRHFPTSCRLYVALGCTEMNTVRRLLVDHTTPLSGSPVPVGYAVDGTEVLLLDEAGEPAAPGGVGEIAIRSRYLSPGYWQRPDLTAAAFQNLPGREERLYRTGDIGRLLPDGCLLHLGRRDEQVKIRGFRVEIAEVEAVLLEHPDVRAAAVVPHKHREGEQCLAAFLVARETTLPPTDELRRFLCEKLPDSMVPAFFQAVESLPLTPTGKLDRRALPAPEVTRELAGAALAPRTSLEEQLCRIWEELLGGPPVGVRDSFFERGGHSLLAARMLVRVEQLTGRYLPPAALLHAPTVEQLAALLDRQEPVPHGSVLVPLQPGGTRLPFFLIHGVGGNVLGYRDLTRNLGLDQPVYGLQAAGLDGHRPCHTRVEEMAAHYVHELRAVQPRGPYFVGGVSFGGRVAFEMAQQIVSQGQTVALLALFDTPARSSARTWTLRQRLRGHAGILRSLRPREALTYLLTRGRKRGRKELALLARRALNRLGPRLPRVLQAVELANQQASRAYEPRVYSGRVTLFRARTQSAGWTDPQLGWADFARGGLEVHVVPGDHTTMLEEPHVQDLAGLLQDCLGRAQHPGRSG
jgi:amino acid adenylation domain-containing protein